MASELHVDAIKHSGGTSALTIDSSGNVSIPGSVVQVVTREIVSADQVTFNSTSYTDSITINFTPKFSNSIIKHTFWGRTALNNRDNNIGQDCRWIRDSTTLSSQKWTNYLNREDYTADFYPPLTWHYVDNPNTTNQVTYKFQGRTYDGASGNDWIAFENNGGTGNRGQWTIEEVAQ